jgi:long-chain fatty acid transport protein
MLNGKVLLAFLLTVTAPRLLALGIRLADQDATATARGNAFVATADNPSAIYYNSAGITQLQGHHLSLGIYSIYLNSEYTAPNGTKFDTKDDLQAVPRFYYTFRPENHPLAYGLGFYSPYGLALEWPDSSSFRSLAKQGRIMYLTMHPVVAWEIVPSLSVAAGPTVNYAQTTLKQGIALPGDQFKFKGDDTDVGYAVGLLWKPHAKHALGVSYRSATIMDFNGHSSVETPLGSDRQPANARFDFPQNIVFGWSYRPTPEWNIEFNADWTDWDQLNTVTLLNQVPVTVYGRPLSSSELQFNWRSSWFYEWGVTRYFHNGFALSGGYIFSENSVPDANFNPIVPDSDRHILSLGLGRKYRHFSWDAAYQLAYGPPRTVRGSLPSPVGQTADGRYEFISHALTISFGYTF